MKEQEEEFIYDQDEVAKFILANVSGELNEKLNHQDIVKLLELESKYIEERGEENEKRKPYLSSELMIIDQDDINYYVMTNAIKLNIILSKEEIEEIMYLELEYMEDNGLLGDDVINFN